MGLTASNHCFRIPEFRFDGCIAPAPWTSPSIASTFTSLHAQNHCVANGYGLFCEVIEDEYVWESLPEEATTMAEVFRGAGYETAGLVGNWVVKAKFGFAQGFDVYVRPTPGAARSARRSGAGATAASGHASKPMPRSNRLSKTLRR